MDYSSEPLDSSVSDSVSHALHTLFFLHGLTASHALFEQQIPHFEDNYNVVVWDAPAHGLSRPYADFTYEKAANDALKILDENRTPEDKPEDKPEADKV